MSTAPPCLAVGVRNPAFFLSMMITIMTMRRDRDTTDVMDVMISPTVRPAVLLVVPVEQVGSVLADPAVVMVGGEGV